MRAETIRRQRDTAKEEKRQGTQKCGMMMFTEKGGTRNPWSEQRSVVVKAQKEIN